MSRWPAPPAPKLPLRVYAEIAARAAQGESVALVAPHYGFAHHVTLHRRLRRLGLPTRRVDPDGLSPSERRVWDLRRQEVTSHAIAERLGWKHETVLVFLSRARRKLREKMLHASN